MIGVAPAIVSHNADIFGADAQCFKPERWLTEDQARQARLVGSVIMVSPDPLSWKIPRSRIDSVQQWGYLRCPMAEDAARAVSELAARMVQHYNFTWGPNGCFITKKDPWMHQMGRH